MNCSLLRVCTAVLLPAAAAAALTAAPAGAAGPANGCPAGYTLLSVSVLTGQGYGVPAQMDSATSGFRSFGQVGNGDGWVCGVQLGNQRTSFGAPIYNFLDNQLPA